MESIEKAIEKPNIEILDEIVAEDKKSATGKYAIHPLWRGFGTTMGNSLRRILLSSIAGSAAVYVKIDGILQEFHAIDGVLEDVTDIVLNLKELPISISSDVEGIIPLKINVKGVRDVTAGDIEADDRVEVIDPSFHIATITEAATSLKMEIGVARGRGYVPTEWHLEDPDFPTERGYIPIDSNFSPVKRVSFNVETRRMGRKDYFDRLMVEVQTDNTVQPGDALSEAALILIRQASFMVDFKERILIEEEKKEEEQKKKSSDLKKTIDELDLSVRSYNCLKNSNILSVEELTVLSESKLKGLRNFGEKSLKEIKTKLAGMGLSLAPEED